MNLASVSPRAFAAMQHLNITELAKCEPNELRPFLPSLVRMTVLQPIEKTKTSIEIRKLLLSLLVSVEEVNNIANLLQIDYQELESDIRKEQQLRQKNGNSNQDSASFHGLKNGVALSFERSDYMHKVRIVLSELFYIQSQIIEQNQQGIVCGINENITKQSELFDNEIYSEEITFIICIALAELPSLFNIQEVVETLLYVNGGNTIICYVVANMPDCFKEVVTALIANGAEETAEGKLRSDALNALCDMNPGHALSTRTLCVEFGRMPSLMLRLSLIDPMDLIAFVSGLLLGNDQNTRSWFALFVRTSQKRKNDALQAMRDELLKQLQNVLHTLSNSQLPEEQVVQGAAILRLYCALRGIAGIKFNDDEIFLILQLVTSKPPPTASGIRFVSLGLCMLIACPSLISQPTLEAKGIEWMQWLIKEEAYFESNSGVCASFGEMLLLMAIHFHSNQVPAICELVCSTLGMKIPLRQNNTTRMKQIFTQEIFTEQVVTSHAIKVPVTPNLNANISGYLPIHCIHQLLKSRAFSKHKVPIKSWIYRQICNSTTPLHPVLPSLIEAYVNSVIVPNSKGSLEHTHKPLTKEDILRVFKSSIAGINLDLSRKNYDFDLKSPSSENNSVDETPNITAQLLLLYYLLLYEDTRLSNMSQILSSGRKVLSYPNDFLSELPIKYLLQQAQRNNQEYSGLFSSLLRLLVTHLPHLSLVDDWIEEERLSTKYSSVQIQTFNLIEAFEEIDTCPSKVIKLLRLMTKKPPSEIWTLAETFIQYFRAILKNSVPRIIQELYKHVWIQLNAVLPRRLWTMSICALIPEDRIMKAHITQENLLFDPLQILRCDERVFRCPDALAIVLRILQASLAASKSQLSRHMLDKPLQEKVGSIQSELEREELKTALVASQESVAVQILLEACLENENDRINSGQEKLREIRGIICSYIHHVFISEPSLARLTHFQGYPRELLSVTVKGIPSMHICIDFIPELIGMPEMDKQIFAIDLTSHLSLQYALPKSLSIAKLCLNTLSTLIPILTNDVRVEMFRAVLPCIVRFSEAFPPLIEDCILLLMQLGRIAESQASLGRSISLPSLSLSPCSRIRVQARRAQQIEKMVEEVQEIFSKLLDDAILKPRVY